MKILIVEQNEQMRRVVKRLVGDLVESIHECSDGEGALSAYTLHRPDWVLMETDLPGIDGISATRLIRAEFPKARILIVTSYDDPDLREKARLAGVREYLVKDNLLALRRILTRETAEQNTL
jgi:CheY-like chemotaxis protein